jgi:hypothetical protein
MPALGASTWMIPPTDDIKNWMTMFRWIVKVIRDEYDIDEQKLVRAAVLESDCGLRVEDIEAVLGLIGRSFTVRFPPGTLDEVLRLEELCMVASWLKGLYKQPDFISEAYASQCRALNAGCQ